MADEEIAKLQAELTAALNEPESIASPKLVFRKSSSEGELVASTIRDGLASMEKMNRQHAPFAQRVQKIVTIFSFVMANPNMVAYHVPLRKSCLNKAHELLNIDYSKYSSHDNFDDSLTLLNVSMQSFLKWIKEILPHNVHYVE